MEGLLDANNPNLDGDFITLLQIQQEKQKSKARNAALISELDEINDATTPDRSNETTANKAGRRRHGLATNLDEDETKPSHVLRDELFQAVQRDDADQACHFLREGEAQGKSLKDADLRRDDDKATALHLALLVGSDDVSRFLIRSVNESILMEDMDVVVRKVPSNKSCLHILVEKDNLELVKMLLEQLQEGTNKQEFMNRGVLSEVEGQRPRHLSALHIAALRGNTQLLEYLVKSGMDVNSTNNKNDTAILWAARWNHIGCVRRLIQLGSDPNHQNDKGSSPLYWAVRYGFPDMVRVLLTEGKADITQKRKLGLVSPIVLAAAYGYCEIVRILIEEGADVNTRITNNQVALHFAAMMGHDDIIDILIDNKAEVDAADDTGNTAMLFAAKSGNLSTMEILVASGGSIDAINKLNQSMWFFAMESPDNDLLKKFIKIYTKVKRMSRRKILFPIGKTPLHVAAMNGDVNKLRCLLDLGVSADCKDLNGNTFFHLAARENKTDVISAFIEIVDANSTNSDGDTALHLASKEGSIEAMKLLVKKSKLDIANENGFTALHTAVKSPHAQSEAVSLLVDAIVTTNNWSLVDARDIHGNTAIHIAALHARDEVMNDLVSLNPSLLNELGENPLHTAAKLGHSTTLDEMLEVFDRPGKGLDLNQQNSDGETLLHVCAKRGDAQMVSALIRKGANLAQRNRDGNAVLHEVAEETTIESTKVDPLLEVYNAIADNSALWWCLRENLPHPDDESESYRRARKEAMLYLTCDVHNLQGFNLLGFCSSIGAVDMLQVILNTPGVYKMQDREKDMYAYDVTNLTPATTPRRRAASNKMSLTSKASSRVDVLRDADNSRVKPMDKSCLEIIANLHDDVLSTQLMDVTPINQLVKNLWNAFQWIYLVLMVVHLTYMSCFTYYSLEIISAVWNTTITPMNNVALTALNPRVFPWILFLIWPLLLINFELYHMISAINSYYADRNIKKQRLVRGKSQKCRCCFGFSIMSLPNGFISFLFSNISHFTALCFSACVIAWFVLYMLVSRMQVYPVTIAMVVGWMFTITFLKGFETVHAFAIMLNLIIVRDITRFLLIYIFVLIAFALGLHSLFIIVPEMYDTYPTTWDSIFTTFRLMLGAADLFEDGNFDQYYRSAGVDPLYVKIVYLIYMILAAIILLNLLIAMMSDTYNAIRSREGTTWRVGSLRLALFVEQSMPFLRKSLIKLGCVDRGGLRDGDRWYMRMPRDELGGKKEDLDENARTLQRLEHRVSHMTSALDELRRYVSATMEEAEVVESHDSEGGTTNRGRRRGSVLPMSRLHSKTSHSRHIRTSAYQTPRK